MGRMKQLLLYLQLCERSVKVEDSVALLDELALLLARWQNHGLHITCEVSYLAYDLDLGRWKCACCVFLLDCDLRLALTVLVVLDEPFVKTVYLSKNMQHVANGLFIFF